MPFPTTQQENLPACSPHCPINASSREDVSSNFRVIGLTRLGIKPGSRAPEAYALTTRPSKLLEIDLLAIYNLGSRPTIARLFFKA